MPTSGNLYEFPLIETETSDLAYSPIPVSHFVPPDSESVSACVPAQTSVDADYPRRFHRVELPGTKFSALKGLWIKVPPPLNIRSGCSEISKTI